MTAMLFLKVVLFLLFIIFLKRIWNMRRIYQMSKHLKNSYRALPFIGHAYMALGTNEDLMNVLKKFSYESMKNEDGITGVWLGMNFFVVVADAQVAKFITKRILEKPDVQAIRNLIGNGSVFAPVKIWRNRRKMISPCFSERRLFMFTEVLGRQAISVVEGLISEADKGTFSLWNHMTTYTMATICEAAFGINLEKIEHRPFLKAFKEYLCEIPKLVYQSWLHPDSIMKTLQRSRSLEKNKNIVWNFIDQIMQENWRRKDENKHMPNNFMEMLMEHSRLRQQTFNGVPLREELLVLTLAATDTTTTAACFTCLVMALYPDCQQRVYEEICGVLQDVTTPSAAQISKLKYLDAVIRETLRLYPPVPITLRKVEEDIELPTGFRIVRGCQVILSTWGVHRNPRSWGGDAEQFNPDRFLDSSIRHNNSFMAFGCGPRNCIGERFAMLSTKMILICILRRFRILPAERQGLCEPITLTYEIMLKEKNNFQVQLELRR